MDIYIPEELKPFEDDLRFFFDLMVRKLHLNRHKGFVEGKEVVELRKGLCSEYEELNMAMGEESQFHVALECADVANMAFLLALACLRMPKNEYNGQSLRMHINNPRHERTRAHDRSNGYPENEKTEATGNCTEVDYSSDSPASKRR